MLHSWKEIDMAIQVNLYHRLDEEEGPMARHVAKYYNAQDVCISEAGILSFRCNGELIETSLPYKIITTK